jgi:hypothetical protein
VDILCGSSGSKVSLSVDRVGECYFNLGLVGQVLLGNSVGEAVLAFFVGESNSVPVGCRLLLPGDRVIKDTRIAPFTISEGGDVEVVNFHG